MLSAYVHVVRTLSGHMRIMCTLSAVVLDMFLPNRQCRCHPYIISTTLYISYHVQVSFHTLSAQTHIVHVICMLSAHVHIICLLEFALFAVNYQINLIDISKSNFVTGGSNTLVVACGFLLQHFLEAVGTYECTSSFYEYRFNGGWWGHSNPTLCKRICVNFLRPQAAQT